MWPGKRGALACGPTRILHHFNMAQLQFAKLYHPPTLDVISMVFPLTIDRSDTYTHGKAICVLLSFYLAVFSEEDNILLHVKRGSAET